MELIVVLSIFAVMASVVIFDYGAFQSRVDIKVLASDIALKIVEAQKASLTGKLPARTYNFSTWKPSYGIYFSIDTSNERKSFIYFTDLDQLGDYTSSTSCPGLNNSTNECLDQISITKGNSISELKVVGDGCPGVVTNLNVVFKRPESGVIITSSPALSCDISFTEISVASPEGSSASIRVYPSGRIQIN